MNIEKKLFMLLEIPEGERNKYEYDKNTNKLILERISIMPYPISYGVLWTEEEEEKTLCEDGDEIDVLCIGVNATPGCLVPIRIIGILKMIDSEERDDKLIAVNSANQDLENIKKIEEINENLKEKIIFFFEQYKDWKEWKNWKKKKKIIIEGWEEKDYALKVLEECKLRYKKYKTLLKKKISKEELIKIMKTDYKKE